MGYHTVRIIVDQIIEDDGHPIVEVEVDPDDLSLVEGLGMLSLAQHVLIQTHWEDVVGDERGTDEQDTSE